MPRPAAVDEPRPNNGGVMATATKKRGAIKKVKLSDLKVTKGGTSVKGGSSIKYIYIK